MTNEEMKTGEHRSKREPSLFVSTVEELGRQHRTRLLTLVGQSLRRIWSVWDTTDGTWFRDEPVVLEFDEAHLLIVFWGMNEVCLEWKTIDFATQPNWYGCWEDLSLEWRAHPIPPCESIIDERLTAVEIVEARHEWTIIEDRIHPEREGTKDFAWNLFGLQFKIGDATLVVCNGLDQNDVFFETCNGDAYRTFPVFN